MAKFRLNDVYRKFEMKGPIPWCAECRTLGIDQRPAKIWGTVRSDVIEVDTDALDSDPHAVEAIADGITQAVRTTMDRPSERTLERRRRGSPGRPPTTRTQKGYESGHMAEDLEVVRDRQGWMIRVPKDRAIALVAHGGQLAEWLRGIVHQVAASGDWRAEASRAALRAIRVIRRI